MVFLVLAIISTVSYLAFVVVAVDKLEQVMMATLIGHEVDELVTELAEDSAIKMPMTATVKSYRQSQDHLIPIPGYLKSLDANAYEKIRVGDKNFQVTIFDFMDDRLYIAFDTTEINRNRSLLLLLIVSGGVVTTVVLLLSGFWLFKKFLLPVSDLASEVSTLDVGNCDIRFEQRYQKYEVGRIARAFDHFLDRLDEFIEREQSFTAAASHELRTPVAVVASALDLLELKGINSNQQDVVKRIREATDYMVNVIDSLLFLARNSYEQIEKTLPELDLETAVLRVMRKYEDLASAKKNRLKFESTFKLRSRMSEAHLEIMLGNLIRNAINSTHDGLISVTLHDNRLSIKDTGRGIKRSEIKLIVKRNYHSPDSAGYGLGLYLVSKICDIYGMKLEIKSTVGKGSEFSVFFPATMLVGNHDMHDESPIPAALP